VNQLRIKPAYDFCSSSFLQRYDAAGTEPMTQPVPIMAKGYLSEELEEDKQGGNWINQVHKQNNC